MTDLSADLHQLPVSSRAVWHHAANGWWEKAQAGRVVALGHWRCRRPLQARLSISTAVCSASHCQSHEANQDPDVGQSKGLQAVGLATCWCAENGKKNIIGDKCQRVKGWTLAPQCQRKNMPGCCLRQGPHHHAVRQQDLRRGGDTP